MKKSLLLFSILTLSTSAYASDEGGPIMPLKDSNTAIDILLLVKSSDLLNFKKSGNTTKTVTVRQYNTHTHGVKGTEYIFVRQQCMTDRVAGTMCIGGAQLTVRVMQDFTHHTLPITVESQLQKIR